MARVQTGRRQNTAARLVAAAAKEFNKRGFDGTDTNKIARRAGFAPQTFYRWFRDKADIFIAVYRAWEDEEERILGALLSRGAPMTELVDVIIDQVRAHRLIRRSLRQLALDNAAVRKARAESRRRQIEQTRRWAGPEARSAPEIAALLLQFDRLCDAIADRELADLGVDETTARQAMLDILRQMRQRKEAG